MLDAIGIAGPPGLPDSFSGLTADSRAVRPGMLYAALPGARADGRAFIAEAVRRGAAAILAPIGTAWPDAVPPRPLILHAEPRRALALLAARQAGAQPETVVAVTGTNGKTSTADFLRQLVALSGGQGASVGTLGVVGPDGTGRPGLTTPDPVTLSATLAELAAAGVTAAAIEASSHGLDQFRLDGLRLAAAGFTNLTRDHLDYHGTFEAYRAAKLRLFAELLPSGALAALSTDVDAETAALVRAAAARRGLDLRTVGPGGTAIDLVDTRPTPQGQVLSLRTGSGPRELLLPVAGRFQADNALLAACLATAAGIADPLALLPRLQGVRGRMELAATLPNGAAAFVDYAHTPDALHRLLAALRPHAAGRLVLVFGAGGDRDPGKRPLMGQAARTADLAIVTDDNPRSEDPAGIRAAIRAAIPDAIEIGDRRAAIAAGLEALRPGDVLAVAGKGHESGQTIGAETFPFDDAAVIRALVAS